MAAMMWQAVVTVLEHLPESLALGFILFGISDTILETNLFLNPVYHSHYFAITTYRMDQFGNAI